jgi:hypothetical protein
MRRLRRRHVAATLVKAPISVQRRTVSQIYSPPLVVRIFPGPPVTISLAYARIRYQVTGQRQWIVAPGLELLD